MRPNVNTLTLPGPIPLQKGVGPGNEATLSIDNQGGRQGSREPKTAQCGAVLLNENVWDLRLFSVRFFAAGPKVDPRVKCIMS